MRHQWGAILALAIFVSGCGQSPTGPRPLKIETDIKVADGAISIEGTTNLPEGTILMTSVYRTDLAFNRDRRIEVGSGGVFVAGPFDMYSRPLPPGKYQVTLSTPSYEIQPHQVQSVVGQDYANFTGPMRVPGIAGMLLRYETTATVEGALSEQDRKTIRDERIRDFRAQLIRNCEEAPAESEQLMGRPHPDPKGLVEECIRNIKTVEPTD